MKKLETIMKICTVIGFIIFFGGHILMFIIFPGPIIDEAKKGCLEDKNENRLFKRTNN